MAADDVRYSVRGLYECLTMKTPGGWAGRGEIKQQCPDERSQSAMLDKDAPKQRAHAGDLPDDDLSF